MRMWAALTSTTYQWVEQSAPYHFLLASCCVLYCLLCWFPSTGPAIHLASLFHLAACCFRGKEQVG